MNDFKTKEFTVLTPFVVKEAEVQDNTGGSVIKISGYCNWSGKDQYGRTYTDLVGDVVVPGGVDLSVWSENPQILWQHDRDETIGKGLLMEKREDGLYIECELHKEAMGEKNFYRVKKNLVCMSSIGFRTMDCEYRDLDGKDVFFITKSLLLEVSVVSIPANSKSSFSIVKSLGAGGFTSDATKRLTEAVDTPKQDEVLTMQIKNEKGEMVELADVIKDIVVGVLDAHDLAAKEAAEAAEALKLKEAEEAAEALKLKEAEEVAEAAKLKEAEEAAEATAVAAAGEEIKSLAAELETIKGLLK